MHACVVKLGLSIARLIADEAESVVIFLSFNTDDLFSFRNFLSDPFPIIWVNCIPSLVHDIASLCINQSQSIHVIFIHFKANLADLLRLINLDCFHFKCIVFVAWTIEEWCLISIRKLQLNSNQSLIIKTLIIDALKFDLLRVPCHLLELLRRWVFMKPFLACLTKFKSIR